MDGRARRGRGRRGRRGRVAAPPADLPEVHSGASSYRFGEEDDDLGGPAEVAQAPVHVEDLTTGRLRTIAGLRRAGTQSFTGIGDARAAELWLSQYEMFTSMAAVTAEDRLVFLPAFLQDTASEWWAALVSGLVDPTQLTWDEFLVHFRERFAPSAHQQRAEDDFLTLVQGDGMSVDQYYQRFTQLMRFATSVAPTDGARLRRFLAGLHGDYQSYVSMANCPTLSAAYGKALELEQIAHRVTTRSGGPMRRTSARHIPGSSRTPYSGSSGSSGSGRSAGSGGDSSPGSPGVQSPLRRQFQRGLDISRGQSGVGRSTLQPAPDCPSCGKAHFGKCRDLRCYRCGRPGHVKKDCPQGDRGKAPMVAPSFSSPRYEGGSSQPSGGRSQSRLRFGTGRGASTGGAGSSGTGHGSGGQARVYAITRQEAEAAPEVISGTLLVMGYDASVLIDPGSTHSFVSSTFWGCAGRSLEWLGDTLSVQMPMGDSVLVSQVFRGCPVLVGGWLLEVDLIPLEIGGFDVILGMDTLSRYRGLVDCFRKLVMLDLGNGVVVQFEGDRRVLPSCVISVVRARKLISKGCDAYLAYVVDSRTGVIPLEHIPVVREFPDIFRDDLPGLPPTREMEFTIDLVPGTAPISLPPFRMAPTELA